MAISRVVRLPSVAEKANAEERNAQAWFPQCGDWWTSQKGDIFFKLAHIPDTVFMLSKPKEQAPQQEAGVDQT